MSNSVPVRSSFPSSWRGKSPGFPEFNALLNLLNEPAILIESHRGQILNANSALLKLTAFTQAEIISTDLPSLLPKYSIDLSTPGEATESSLNRRQRDPLEVMVRAIFLDTNNLWAVLAITPLSIYQQTVSNEQRQEKVYQAFLDLADLVNQTSMDAAIQMAMRIGKDLLDTSLLCIYQANPQSPQLVRRQPADSSLPAIFPDTLPSLNLIRLQEPYLWLPGKKVTSDLHRIARISNLNYLATVPLGQEGAWFGLLVAADPHSPPVDQVLTLLTILGANLSAAMQQFILVTNLNQTLQNNIQSLIIRNTIAENAQEGIIFLKPDLTIFEMNPAAELILGYASQEVIGKPAESILIGAETITAALKSALEGIPTPNLGNINLHRRSGQPFLAHIQTIPVMDKSRLLSIIVFLSDVSENEQIRVRTQQLEQRAVLGEVTAIFAHEVRNPINNISTGLQLMGMSLAPDDPNQEMIARLQHDCSRLTHLMESVLSFSRPMEYRLEPTDLSALMRRILDRWQPRMARANVTSFFQAIPSIPQVNGDARALEQVFTNLISNAVHAMSASGGTLAIKVALVRPPQEHPQVEVTVSDSGPGIPDEIRDHIFEPFVTTNPQGTGLGLAITRRIVTAHKGSINVNSFPGGTMFTVCLPAIIGEDT